MTLPIIRTVNIPQVLEQIYAAQALMTTLPPTDEAKITALRRAVDSAISVVVIYLKLGREPRVMPKHYAGVDRLAKLLEDLRTTC